MLDAVLDYLPAPTDVPAIKGTLPDSDEEVTRESSDDAPFSALAFKVMTDPYVGKLTFFRVYSGTLDSGSYVRNSTKGKRERVGRILQMHANSREEISTVYAGDIAAAVGLKDTTTGDTLCDEKTLLSWNQWNSLSLLSTLQSSLNLRLTKTKCLLHWLNWLKRIQHSVRILTLKQVKRSSAVWVSFTLISSLTV